METIADRIHHTAECEPVDSDLPFTGPFRCNLDASTSNDEKKERVTNEEGESRACGLLPVPGHHNNLECIVLVPT